jgi:NAD(P)-dependent dehydrogenase (short-subunit alcohol dehydrogenase family)
MCFPADCFQITHVSADAASASAISSLVNQAIEKEGHLDFFFANAGISQIVPKTKSEAAGGDLNDKLREIQKLTANSTAISEEDYMEVMRINALG